MILFLRKIINILPWILAIGLLSWMLVEEKLFGNEEPGYKEVHQSAILSKVEQMGKLELVKYNFQEVTEVKKVAKYIDLKLFKYKSAPDSKAVLISRGSAVGCIDLSQVGENEITQDNDIIYIELPAPELCFFKIDLENSRIYDLQIDYMNKADKALFMEELYKEAELNVRTAALDMGIMNQTQENAKSILTPLFEALVDKQVIITFKPYPASISVTQ